MARMDFIKSPLPRMTEVLAFHLPKGRVCWGSLNFVPYQDWPKL